MATAWATTTRLPCGKLAVSTAMPAIGRSWFDGFPAPAAARGTRSSEPSTTCGSLFAATALSPAQLPSTMLMGIG